MHDQKRGDIRNLGAGTVWDRSTNPDPLVPKIAKSPDYLGSKNADTLFAALKYDDGGDFTTTYKFDWEKAQNTPEGTALVGLNPGVGSAGAAVAGFVNTLIKSQPFTVPIVTDGKRPDAVYNSFVVPSSQFSMGHNLTSTWKASDRLTIKNILAYRKVHQWATSSLAGVDTLPITAAAAPLFGLPNSLIGQPFLIVGGQSVSRNTQWSDELQLNYNSSMLTLTAGALWFRSKDTSNTFGFQATQSFAVLANNVTPQGNQTSTYNTLTSLAAYAQAEVHVTPQLDLVLGGRINQDRKFGRYVLGTPVGTPQVLTTVSSSYKDTRPTYLVGVNYKPSQDALLYAKYSTAFVSGGSIAGYPFAVEKARSAEAGVKAEFLDRKLRTNLALYWVKYTDTQSSQSASILTGVDPRLGTFIVSAGDITSNGFEAEITAAPVRGLTLGGSLSYSDNKTSNVPALLLAANGGDYNLVFRPKWTAGLWGQYDTPPVFGDGYLTLRADANWQSRSLLSYNAAQTATWSPAGAYIPPYWLVNARVALRDIAVAGAKFELAAWSKNLTNTRSANYGIVLFNQIAQATFTPARTYGLDLSVQF